MNQDEQKKALVGKELVNIRTRIAALHERISHEHALLDECVEMGAELNMANLVDSRQRPVTDANGNRIVADEEGPVCLEARAWLAGNPV